jgi:hypothetical protein
VGTCVSGTEVLVAWSTGLFCSNADICRSDDYLKANCLRPEDPIL